MNLWGFERITRGAGKGGYERNEFFSRKDLNQISNIKRRKIKNARIAKKKLMTTTTIVDVPTSKLENEQYMRALGSSSIVSNSCSDVSSISSDSDFERRSTSMNEDMSPIPISEMIQHGNRPQSGDWSDFGGRSFFCIDEEETESKRMISQSSFVSPQSTKQTISPLRMASLQRSSPQEITLCPSSRAGIALYRQFFSSKN